MEVLGKLDGFLDYMGYSDEDRAGPPSRWFPRERFLSPPTVVPLRVELRSGYELGMGWGVPGSSHSEGGPEAKWPLIALMYAVTQWFQRPNSGQGPQPSPQLRGKIGKRGYGAPERKLRWPLLHWGRKPPRPGQHSETSSSTFSFLSHSQRTGWGISSSTSGASQGLLWGAARLLPILGRDPGDLPVGCGGLLPLFPPFRVGTHHASSSLSLHLAQNNPLRQVLASHFL